MVIQSRALPVIMTRPADQGRRFADRLVELAGDRIRLVHSPLLAPRFFSPVLPDLGFVAVIFTSQTAVTAVAQHVLRDKILPRLAFCVGDQTANAARVAGFDAISAHGDGDQLVAEIKRCGMRGPFLHLRGHDVRGEIAKRLCSAGIETHDAVVYVQEAQPLVPAAEAVFADDTPVIIPLFSPRTAQILVQQMSKITIRSPVFTVSISQAVSAEWKDQSRQRDDLASAPNQDAMMAAFSDALVAAESA
jgi:uroporphyrinogen-III synthase